MLTLFIGACAALGLAFLLLAVSAFRRRRPVASAAHVLVASLFLSAALLSGFLGASLLTYQRLTHEQPAADLAFTALGERHFRVVIREPRGYTQTLDLRGDEWQVDARILKWHGFANVLGFDTVYRLERIGGRYRTIADERTAPRTVHALHEPDRIDTWEVARHASGWLPFLDAKYGSAVFLPMADGAVYRVTVSQSGLVARALNAPAQAAAGGWK